MKQLVHTTCISTIADLLTPVGLYVQLRDRFPQALLLESADYHDRSDSKSFICLEPIAGFEATVFEYHIQLPAEQKQISVKGKTEVLEAFQGFVNCFEAANTVHDQAAGLFGYTAFEAVEYMEDITLDNSRAAPKDNPDLKYQLFRFVLVFDHFKNELILCENSFDKPASEQRLRDLLDVLLLPGTAVFPFRKAGPETVGEKDAEFKQKVEAGIHHCLRGDVFQVVLSREFQQPFQGDDFNVYRALRSINPSPYLFYFDYGDFKIFGSSPEAQLQVDEGTAVINPIAGTVLRSTDPEEDRDRALHLQNDPKEKAEHVMLVDLARNDLNKHAQDVSVDTYAEIQYFSHVIHMVSKVSGKMQEGKSNIDLFAATFPAGTLSGAPKHRALQIINEQELVSRNFYGGAIGFFGFNGQVNHAIIIRSILSKNNTLVYQAGAGIVAGSTAEGELNEVNNKVAALRKAIEKATTL